MASAMFVAVIAGVFSSFAALISGAFTLWNSWQAGRTASELEFFKANMAYHLTNLNARLEHGKLISATQWNAEFSAYQALWKSVVPIRGVARKIVLRESEMAGIGLESGDVGEDAKIVRLRPILAKYAEAVSNYILVINENAPFYPAEIRRAANAAHECSYRLLHTKLAEVLAEEKGQATVEIKGRMDQMLKELMQGTDSLEAMIRKRLAEVRVAL